MAVGVDSSVQHCPLCFKFYPVKISALLVLAVSRRPRHLDDCSYSEEALEKTISTFYSWKLALMQCYRNPDKCFTQILILGPNQLFSVNLYLLYLTHFQLTMRWQVSCPGFSTISRSVETTPSRSSATPSPPTPWTALGAGGCRMRSTPTNPMAR